MKFDRVRELILTKGGYVLSALLAGGGQYAEIFFESVRQTRMRLEGSIVGEAAHGYDAGVGLRLVKDFKVYYAYTNDPSFENLMELARALARAEGQGPIRWGLIKRVGKTETIVDPDAVGFEERLELLKRAREAALSIAPDAVQVTSLVADRSRRILVVNSLGEIAEDEQKRVVFFTEVVVKREGELFRGFESAGASAGFELFKSRPPEEIAREAARRALTLASAKPAPAGRFTVVMDASAGGTMIHEAVGHGLEADLVQKGVSVYDKSKLGKKVASELVTVIDDATIPGLSGSYAIDDEGVPGQRKVLIEKGILVGYMYDRLSAMRDGVESTGNGRRQSYRHVPMVRMSNTFIAPGKDDPEAIIADTKLGVLVVKMGGGEVNTATGDFVFEVSEGYMIENGKVTYPIRGATLIGNGPEALKNVDAVGKNLGWSIGTCGKSGQGVPVTDAQPTVRIRSLTVGGTQL